MCYIFLVISIVIVVSGQEESKYSTTFLDRDVNALINQLHRLSLENKEIVNFCSRIAKDNENLKTLIHTLVDKNEVFERRFNLMEKNIPFSNNQQKRHGSDSNIHDVLFNNLTEIYGQGHRLIAKNSIPMLMSKKIDNNNFVKDKRFIQQGTLGEVAFFGRVSETLQNLGDNQEIPFKDIIVDTQNGFHGESGIFTTPVAGYYAVFATIMTFPGIRVEFEIIKDGTGISAGYSRGNSDAYGTGTTSGIVNLNVGDKVWIKVNGNGHTGSGNMVYKGYSSFMGFRL